MLKNLNQVKIGYTHTGVFHADDVFAAALLQIINPNVEVRRISDGNLAFIDDDDETIIFDIGRGQYDHHQTDKATRPMEDGYYVNRSNGEVLPIPYCSFGLFWRDYGRLLCPSPKAWKKVDRDLVIGIDRADNGVAANAIASAIGQFNPAWNDDEANPDLCFESAVSSASVVLGNYIHRANAEAEAERLVLSSQVFRDCILVLDRYMPWADTVIEKMPNILFVIHPSNRGGYAVQAVPKEAGSMEKRRLFPTEWLGNPDRSLGMTFCHTGNFTLSCETEAQAIHCAEIAAGLAEKAS